MDVNITLIVLSALKPLVWVLPLIAIIAILKTPRIKGKMGELVITLIAKIKLPKDVYHPVHNVTLPVANSTTQIDHIFVSIYGVFVVETKNMKGWIFGGEKQSKWTQKIYKNTYTFQNPLHQNYKHVKALEATLEIPTDSIQSVVAFTGDNTFKTDMPKNVTRGIGYIDYIKSFSQPVLTKTQVQNVLERIQSGRLQPSRKTDKDHVQNLKATHEAAAGKVCPECGLKMVQRTAKKGRNSGNQFWGCTGFPTCRAVRKIS